MKFRRSRLQKVGYTVLRMGKSDGWVIEAPVGRMDIGANVGVGGILYGAGVDPEGVGTDVLMLLVWAKMIDQEVGCEESGREGTRESASLKERGKWT
eukprot:753476-Hanusia_phi.AAC.14